MKKSIKSFFVFEFLMSFTVTALLVLGSQTVRASLSSTPSSSFLKEPIFGLEHLQKEVHAFLKSFHEKDPLLELKEDKNDLMKLERILQSGDPALWSDSLAQRLTREEPLEFNIFLFYLLDIYRYEPEHRPALMMLFNALHGASTFVRWEERSRRSYHGAVLGVLDGALLGALLLMTVRSGKALSQVGVFKKHPRIRFEFEKFQKQLKSFWEKIRRGKSSSSSLASSSPQKASSSPLISHDSVFRASSRASKRASSRELVKRPSSLTKTKGGERQEKVGSFPWMRHQLQNPYFQLALAVFGGSLYGGTQFYLYSLSEERVNPLEALKGIHWLLIAELSWQTHDLLDEINGKRLSTSPLKEDKIESLKQKLEIQRAGLEYLQEVAPTFGVSQPLPKEAVELLVQDQDFISACGCSVKDLKISLRTIEEDLKKAEMGLLSLQDPSYQDLHRP